MSEIQRRNAEQRLLEVLLAEEFERADAAGGAAARDGRLQLLPPEPRARSSWRIAAAVLLGTAVVALSMLGAARDEQRAATQDPDGVEIVTPKDVDEYLEHLAAAVRIQLVRKETVGAGRVSDDDGSADRLDTVRWPEVVRIDGEQLATWREALQRCARRTEKCNRSGSVYDFELVLPRGRIVRSFCSVLGEHTRIWIADGHPLKPNEGLQALLDAADRRATELRRRALGQVIAPEELLALPRDARRLQAPVKLFANADVPAHLPELERLLLRGQPTPSTWEAIAKLDQLRQLELVGASLDDATLRPLGRLRGLRAQTLRECEGFTGEGLHALGALRDLHTLHLVDTAPIGSRPDAAGLDLQGLASLPRLREFGLRAQARLEHEHLETISRTKIERLLLIDLDLQGDLGLLQHLPSLQDVVLVGQFTDGYLQPLSTIDSLRRLTVRNAKVDGSFVDAILEEVPGLEIDWTFDARWWHTDYAFRYVERAWPVVR